ncbi:hypothetical protein RF11_01133 [Thelohanellus kitauei]|uniref:MD-2-related lipid-recognition domain-containing protein n=1 Tax=Thelohanellus kitauei TaxID=669202 RepID=A0A0C2IG94_THEKT|nr:hypothetical protein RF11_01133 [Thelohanellus kitauei]
MSFERSFHFLTITLFYLVLIEAAYAQYRLCDRNILATVEDVPGCSFARCEFKRGSRVTAKVHLTPKVSSEGLRLECVARWLIFRFAIPCVENSDISARNLSFPWLANEMRELNLPLAISYWLNRIKPTLSFKFTNDSKQVVGCFQVTVHIYT